MPPLSLETGEKQYEDINNYHQPRFQAFGRQHFLQRAFSDNHEADFWEAST